MAAKRKLLPKPGKRCDESERNYPSGTWCSEQDPSTFVTNTQRFYHNKANNWAFPARTISLKPQTLETSPEEVNAFQDPPPLISLSREDTLKGMINDSLALKSWTSGEFTNELADHPSSESLKNRYQLPNSTPLSVETGHPVERYSRNSCDGNNAYGADLEVVGYKIGKIEIGLTKGKDKSSIVEDPEAELRGIQKAILFEKQKIREVSKDKEKLLKDLAQTDQRLRYHIRQARLFYPQDVKLGKYLDFIFLANATLDQKLLNITKNYIAEIN